MTLLPSCFSGQDKGKSPKSARPPEDLLREILNRNHFRVQEIVLLGGEYRRVVPEEAEVQTLIRALLDRNDLSEGMSGVLLAEELAGRIEMDFANGDLLLLDGWFVSRNEGRICALAEAWQKKT